MMIQLLILTNLAHRSSPLARHVCEALISTCGSVLRPRFLTIATNDEYNPVRALGGKNPTRGVRAISEHPQVGET